MSTTRGDEPADPRQRDRAEQEAGPSGEPAGRRGEKPAESELPGARRERVERPRLVDAREPERRGERCRHDRADHERDAPPGAAAGERHDHERRPEQVELLLDAERPEVAEGRRRRGPEVVRRVDREADVADREGRRRAVEGDLREVQRCEDEGRHADGHHDRDERCGEDPPHPARVEGREADPARPLVLADDQAGDQEARQDEEGVDADEAAGRPREPEMEQEDGDDGDPAKTLEVGPDLARPFGRGRADRAGAVGGAATASARARAGKDPEEKGRGTALDVHLSPPLWCGLEPHL